VVYLAAGLGVVPVLDQIRALAPRGASSVDTASVVWLNERREAFDLAMDALEAEYLRHPTELAVSCVLLDEEKGDGKEGGGPWEGHREVEEAVPYFDAGTMAVVCGETRFADGARGYLMRRGYPEDCICVLPL
jgi:ferredoxin-NADP reductase